MNLSFLFDEDAKAYDRYRPTYCPELFQAILGCAARGQAVEVGCGTGQATAPFLKAGYFVHAVEPGKRLAAYAAEKFRDFPGFRVYNLPFEAYHAPAESIELLYSATAFHWIPEEIGYPKAFELLKPGGTIALFWNRPAAARPGEPLHADIQKIYRSFFPNPKPQGGPWEEIYRRRDNTLLRYGFQAVKTRVFYNTRQFCAEDYIGLLLTYSDHRSMPEPARTAFLQQVEKAIHAYGGSITVYDTIDLHLAQKPVSL